jgi:hypothetical protein
MTADDIPRHAQAHAISAAPASKNASVPTGRPSRLPTRESVNADTGCCASTEPRSPARPTSTASSCCAPPIRRCPPRTSRWPTNSGSKWNAAGATSSTSWTCGRSTTASRTTHPRPRHPVLARAAAGPHRRDPRRRHLAQAARRARAAAPGHVLQPHRDRHPAHRDHQRAAAHPRRARRRRATAAQRRHPHHQRQRRLTTHPRGPPRPHNRRLVTRRVPSRTPLSAGQNPNTGPTATQQLRKSGLAARVGRVGLEVRRRGDNRRWAIRLAVLGSTCCGHR